MRYLLCFIFIISWTIESFSQKPGFRQGILIGVGESRIIRANINDQFGKVALVGGLVSNFQITPNVGLVAEMLFSFKGSRVYGTIKSCCQDFKYEDNYKLNYAEIPVMVKGSINISNIFLKVFTGPSLNFNLKGSTTRIFDDSDFNMQNGYVNRKLATVNLLEVSWVGGVGIDVPMEENETVSFEIRNSMGITNFDYINGSKGFNEYFVFGIGYLY